MTTPSKTRAKRSRHGLNAALARVKLLGLNGIDRRTRGARALLRWREQLITDLGGIDAISSQRLALVDLACRTKALVDHADGWLLLQSSIVNKRRKALLPIVAQRQSLCDGLARLLSLLGLERQQRPIKSLHEYIAEKTEPAS